MSNTFGWRTRLIVGGAGEAERVAKPAAGVVVGLTGGALARARALVGVEGAVVGTGDGGVGVAGTVVLAWATSRGVADGVGASAEAVAGRRKALAVTNPTMVDVSKPAPIPSFWRK